MYAATGQPVYGSLTDKQDDDENHNNLNISIILIENEMFYEHFSSALKSFNKNKNQLHYNIKKKKRKIIYKIHKTGK